ncbi:hypothetical protein GGQ54_002265 [Naumannella cuiyingiana]|uniref:SIR2-like domain-containing protein n=1 Tax=Naumannella cuiyingiana TaxID=1347891 RepID=A0A7Z0ILK0_9ACTN|nr:hypothetical protein [Naumannella cuiyingiana]NYI71705.1 hypothetical protein [Naumannella cuiyingiana]
MTDVRINGVAQQPVSDARPNRITPERLRTIVESAHLNFLIGAGTSSPYFAALGNIEDALADVADQDAPEHVKALVRASIQAYFFEKVLAPNVKIVERDESAEAVLRSYATFVRTLNRILLRRHSTLLSKQANIFTTNVDMLFEVAMEELGIDFSDGFSGKIRPKFDLGDFSTLRFRVGSRYEHRFEVPVFNLIKIHGSAAWRQQERENRKTDIYFDHGLTLVNEVGKLFQAAKPHLLSVLVDPQPDDEGPTIRPIADLITEARQYLDGLDLLGTSGEGESPTPSDVDAFSAGHNKLGIVNPDKRKFATTVLNETYYELIRRFANEVEKESSVLFVHGFSFRDEHLRDLVLRAARTNPTLQVIVFCYSRGGLNAYEKLLPDAEIKNGNIQFAVPDEPSEDEEERKISLDVLESDYFAPIIRDKVPEPDQRIELDIHTSTSEPLGD